MSRRMKWQRGACFVGLVIVTAAMLYPLLLLVFNSLKTRQAFYQDQLALPAPPLNFGNYLDLLTQFQILTYMKNTVVVVIVSEIPVMLLSIIASYAFAKHRFRARNLFYLFIVAQMAIPSVVTMTPLYVLFGRLGLLNNLLSIVLVYLTSFAPANIMLLTAYYRSLPGEVLDSARIDGCGYLQTVFRIVAPMGIAAMTVNIIFNVFSMWNDLFTPMLLLNKLSNTTITVALALTISKYNDQPTFQFAGLVMSAIPITLFYIAFQKNIVNGIMAGALK